MKKKSAKIIFQDIFIGSQISLLKQEKEGQLKAADVPKYLGCLTPRICFLEMQEENSSHEIHQLLKFASNSFNKYLGHLWTLL